MLFRGRGMFEKILDKDLGFRRAFLVLIITHTYYNT